MTSAVPPAGGGPSSISSCDVAATRERDRVDVDFFAAAFFDAFLAAFLATVLVAFLAGALATAFPSDFASALAPAIPAEGAAFFAAVLGAFLGAFFAAVLVVDFLAVISSSVPACGRYRSRRHRIHPLPRWRGFQAGRCGHQRALMPARSIAQNREDSPRPSR